MGAVFNPEGFQHKLINEKFMQTPRSENRDFGTASIQQWILDKRLNGRERDYLLHGDQVLESFLKNNCR